jgi:glutathione S-transferase
VAAARGRFATAVGPVVAAIGNGSFLVADSFSVADVVVGSVLSFARTAEIAELPAEVVPYVDRLEARPARQRATAVALPA